MASWGIVSTVRAPRFQCEMFARHYLSIGASSVTFFHDDPAAACIFEMEGVKHIVCDDAYWKKRRPDGLEKRQRKNATTEMRTTSVDWLMHCDIDELCYSQTAISEVLSHVDEDVGGVMVPCLEAVYASEPGDDDIYTTCFFKAYISRDGEERAYSLVSSELFGDIWIASKAGFWGHMQGKSFVRTSIGIGQMPLHHKQEDVPGFRMRVPTDQITLRHYDTSSFSLWKEKHLRRINGSVLVPQAGKFRAAQQEIIQNAFSSGGDAALKELYLKMSVLTPDKMIIGIKSDFIRVIQPEPHLLTGVS